MSVLASSWNWSKADVQADWQATKVLRYYAMLLMIYMNIGGICRYIIRSLLSNLCSSSSRYFFYQVFQCWCLRLLFNILPDHMLISSLWNWIKYQSNFGTCILLCSQLGYFLSSSHKQFWLLWLLFHHLPNQQTVTGLNILHLRATSTITIMPLGRVR